MGGEAYLAFKPGLIDDANAVTEAGTRQFLQAFVDRFAELAARLGSSETNARAA
jgi:chromate reductase